MVVGTYDPENLLLQAQDPATLGYLLFSYSDSKGLARVAANNATIRSLKRARDKECYYLVEESYELPPQLVRIDTAMTKAVIYKTNPQQQDYLWGYSRLIQYNANGKTGLKGALFYPAGYDPRKSYPMVVYIYETLSQRLHRYVPPGLKLYEGFNVTNYTTGGYFVLMPDIAYTLNTPGRSALNCVLAASEKTLETASVDRDRIALMGHSYGGFETCYIISQTDFFKTAVAGAAPVDLLSFYLGRDASGVSNMQRFNNGQFRNRLPFLSKEFLKESPLHNAASINTPLLLWAGEKDRLVDPSHSLKLYSALWRLKKESALLLYANEQHVIEEPKRQVDLYRKVREWLDHYLKDGPKPKWAP